MNIFVVDNDAVFAAQMLCDKHVVKMVVETAQILSTSMFLRGVWNADLYKPTHVHHPCVSWAGESHANFAWLVLHGLALSYEYTRRYRKVHKTDKVLRCIEASRPRSWCVDPGCHSPFVQCMPDKYKGHDAVEAYRRFYIGEKARFARWRYTSPPSWFSV